MIDYYKRELRQQRIIAITTPIAWVICTLAMLAIIGFESTAAALAGVVLMRWLRD